MDMSQKMPADEFRWVENTSHFHTHLKTSWKTTMKIVIKDIFLKFMLNILKEYMIFTLIYHLYLKE